MPSSASTVICVQTPVLPVYSQEPSSQVSLPSSPGCGMVWKIQRRSPVRASKPRMYPFALRRDGGVPPGRLAAPMSTTSPATTGAPFQASSLVIGSRS